ncbi:MAG: TIGR03013 family XrtA/PEP-CTERM system glycosyltransferase, partial [Geminicoccaceae bacterium]
VFVITDHVRASGDELTSNGLLDAAAFACTTMLAIFAIGAYQGDALRSTRVLVPRLLTGAVIGAFAMYLGWIVPEYGAIPPWQMLLLAMLAAGVLIGARLLGLQLRGLRQALKPKVLVLGTGAGALAVWHACGERYGIRLQRFLDPIGDLGRAIGSGLPVDRVMPLPADLALLARHEHASEIVVALDDRRRKLPVEMLLRCRMQGIRVTDESSFIERATGRLDLESLRPSWLIFADGFHCGRAGAWAKRGLDLVFSAGLLAIMAPLLAVIALAIKLDSPGPVFYRQRRVGLQGRLFSILKFRTMREDAESDGRARWASPDDDRVTRVGYVLRRMRFDELPQLWNVLRGEMSVVGPRPERPEFVAGLAEKIPFYQQRHQIRPGITGWAQISCSYGASEEDARLKLSYDLYYLKNRSFSFDLVILIRTVGTVLFSEGAR